MIASLNTKKIPAKTIERELKTIFFDIKIPREGCIYLCVTYITLNI